MVKSFFCTVCRKETGMAYGHEDKAGFWYCADCWRNRA